MHTYRNPWFRPSGHDPEIYRCETAPRRIGKYLCYYRIKDGNPSRRCYDYVLNGVVVTQRCGGGLTEEQLDAYLAGKAECDGGECGLGGFCDECPRTAA